MRADGQRENIPDLALGRLEAHGSNENHVGENFGVGCRHLCRDEAAGGEADDVDGIEVQLSQHSGVQTAEVAVAPDPVEPWGFSKAGLERNHQLTLPGEFLIPGHPARVAQLVMKHKQGLARAALNEHQFRPGDIGRGFGPICQ